MSQKFLNSHNLKSLRKQLRKKQTKPEILLWSKIRDEQIGYKFRRQHSIGKYIVDLYCPALRLIVEVDGPYHFETDETRQKDRKRQNFFLENNFNIIRFTTFKVEGDLETVLRELQIACDNLRTSTSSVSSSSEEENV